MKRDIFQAIADPTRRAIIALIALQAMTPNAIAENFHTTRQAVSKHLRILIECELVTQEYKGREIYYSLEKLARAELIRSSETGEAAAGPERSTFETTEKGRAALADALEREEWTTQRDHPVFLTWLALSRQARPGVFHKQLKKRRKFLLKELAREKKTLQSIYAEVGHKFHEAIWMVGLMIDQLATEVRWTKQLERELARRAKALHPQFAEG